MVPYDDNLPPGDLPIPPRTVGAPSFNWTSHVCFTVVQTEWAQAPPTTTGLTKTCLPPNEDQPSVATSYALLCGAYNQLLAANAFGAARNTAGIWSSWTDLGILRHIFTDQRVAHVLSHSLHPDHVASLPYPEDPLTVTGITSARMLAFLALYSHDNLSLRYGPGLAHEHRNFPWPIPALQLRALPAPLCPVPLPPPPQPSSRPPPPFQPHAAQGHQQQPTMPLLAMTTSPKHPAPPRPEQFCGNCFLFGKHWAANCTSETKTRPTDLGEQRRIIQAKARQEGQSDPRPKHRKRAKALSQQPSVLNPTLNSQSSIMNPEPTASNLQPSTFDPQSSPNNHQSSNLDPQTPTPNPQFETFNPQT